MHGKTQLLELVVCIHLAPLPHVTGDGFSLVPFAKVGQRQRLAVECVQERVLLGRLLLARLDPFRVVGVGEAAKGSGQLVEIDQPKHCVGLDHHCRAGLVALASVGVVQLGGCNIEVVGVCRGHLGVHGVKAVLSYKPLKGGHPEFLNSIGKLFDFGALVGRGRNSRHRRLCRRRRGKVRQRVPTRPTPFAELPAAFGRVLHHSAQYIGWFEGLGQGRMLRLCEK
mmetsp:Transcript_2365/g.5770  ORF Transcript_2365/g.5770 Transcript_2365/m.5770 type:complete len:225 (+) Transcript_2365:1232-1906(+)